VCLVVPCGVTYLEPIDNSVKKLLVDMENKARTPEAKEIISRQ